MPSVTYTLSLHDALPIFVSWLASFHCTFPLCAAFADLKRRRATKLRPTPLSLGVLRSEEHTSELQSRFDLVCRLLLEKKNNSFFANNSCFAPYLRMASWH